MTLLHTKGYSEVLESVKMRAQKKAKQMARMQVNVKVATVLESLRQIANTIVLLAAVEIEGELADVSYNNFTKEEDEELRLVAAEDVLHHYRFELDQIRSERVAADEVAEAEATNVR